MTILAYIVNYVILHIYITVSLFANRYSGGPFQGNVDHEYLRKLTGQKLTSFASILSFSKFTRLST